MSASAVGEPLVLLVEDEESFIEALRVGLAREGFRVEVARDGAEALERFDEISPDIVLLDLMLPRVSGVDVCRELRTRSLVPIVMVTAKTSEVDMVVGLELGADDYVSKPYRMRELVARMRAVLRRSSQWENLGRVAASDKMTDPQEDRGDAVAVGDVVIDRSRYELTIRGESKKLPLKEFELLGLLMINAGLVVSRDTLIDRVWGDDYEGDTKTLDVHIQRLRAKIEVDPSQPTRIITIRGVGYKYARPDPGCS